MDISVLLALDTAAFQQGLKAAADALGQFKAGADVCFEALGKAQAQIDAAADASAKEAAKVTEAAEAAKAKAEAEKEAAAATRTAAEAEEKHADSAGTLANELGKAKGAMGVASGAASALQGDFRGVAAGTMQAAQGMRALGLSIQAVEKASVVLAAIGLAVAAVSAAVSEFHRQAQSLRQIQLDNLSHWAESARDRFNEMNRELERSIALAKGLEDASSAGRRLEQERKLAELERDRNRELAAGGDAEVVNRRYDARRREMEFSFQREDAASGVSSIRTQMADNERRIASLKAQYDEAERIKKANEGTAGWAAEQLEEGRRNPLLRLGRTVVTGNTDSDLEEHRSTAAAAAQEQAKAMIDLQRQIMELEDSNKILAENLKVAQGRSSVLDIQEEAARLAAAIPKKPESEAGPAPEKPAKEHSAGSWGSLQTASDRLARIGGFVGGSNMVQNQAREQLQVDRRRNQILEQIERNTSNGGQGAAILA